MSPPARRSGPRKLSVVDQSLPADAPESDEARAARKLVERNANLAAGRAQIAANRAAGKRKRAAGEKSPWERFKAGEYPIEQWTDDEISHGRPADIGGGFSGGDGKVDGKSHLAIRRELLKRGQSKIDGFYFRALAVLDEVATNSDSDAARVKAANLLMERTAGRTIERIEIKSSDPWADILEDVLNEEVLAPVVEPEDAQ